MMNKEQKWIEKHPITWDAVLKLDNSIDLPNLASGMTPPPAADSHLSHWTNVPSNGNIQARHLPHRAGFPI